MRVRTLNGYRVLYLPEHQKAMKSKNWFGFIYEHIAVAEEFLGRALLSSEIVHHLDLNRKNNRKENLLVLDKSQHNKLHAWLDRVNLESNKEIKTCVVCRRTLQEKQSKTCSVDCFNEVRPRKLNLTKQELLCQMNNLSYAYIGRQYNVSGNAVKKLARKYQLI